MPRLELAGWPQLLVQRVLPGQVLVVDEEDVALWRSCVASAARDARVVIHAYVVTPDHFHLLATPAETIEKNLKEWNNAKGMRAAYKMLRAARYKCLLTLQKRVHAQG